MGGPEIYGRCWIVEAVRFTTIPLIGHSLTQVVLVTSVWGFLAMIPDYFSVARTRRLEALETLDRRQPDLPGLSEPSVPFEKRQPDEQSDYPSRLMAS
jgi:hypothetical protein